MIGHFADKLSRAIQRKRSRLCVGIDPRFELLPGELVAKALDRTSSRAEAAAMAVRDFSLSVIEAVSPIVPCVKVQLAYFEALGWRGLKAFDEVTRAASDSGLVVIADGKRGDIGATSEAYARAYLGGFKICEKQIVPFETDALTVNPYMGGDAVLPFVKQAAENAKGVFVLVRTSNPSGAELQDRIVDGRPVWEHVADLVHEWGDVTRVGDSGYLPVGAVVGATRPAELARLRELLPDVIFLVPGFGAQGGSAADTVAAFDKKGLGAVVNSSRAILFPKSRRGALDDSNWMTAVVQAAKESSRAINEAIGIPE